MQDSQQNTLEGLTLEILSEKTLIELRAICDANNIAYHHKNIEQTLIDNILQNVSTEDKPIENDTETQNIEQTLIDNILPQEGIIEDTLDTIYEITDKLKNAGATLFWKINRKLKTITKSELLNCYTWPLIEKLIIKNGFIKEYGGNDVNSIK